MSRLVNAFRTSIPILHGPLMHVRGVSVKERAPHRNAVDLKRSADLNEDLPQLSAQPFEHRTRVRYDGLELLTTEHGKGWRDGTAPPGPPPASSVNNHQPSMLFHV